MATDYTLIWSNSDLQITGPENPKLQKKLRYTEKSMVRKPTGYGFQVRFKSVDIYNMKKNADGTVTYQTFQGMIDVVIELLKKDNFTYTVLDSRGSFPEPKLERMRGFRFNQQEVITKALLAERSGLVAAPTRYGKTILMTNTITAYPDLKIAVLAPGIDLLQQLRTAIETYCPGREVAGIYTGSKSKKESDDVTVCSFDSMHKLNMASYDLVLIDEPHAAVSQGRAYQLLGFTKARILGFGATLEGRWSGNDIMIKGLIGPIISEVTYKECVKMGALCPIHVYFVHVPYKGVKYKNRDVALRKYLYGNEIFQNLVGQIANDLLPKEWQTLLFINNEKQADNLLPKIQDGFLAMAKLFKNKEERSDIFAKLKNEELKRVLCTNIYSTGVTIDNLRAIVNCDAAGAGGILSIQKPGRLAEIKPNKKEGVLIDFLFSPTNADECTPEDLVLYKSAMARYQAYVDKGYMVDVVTDINQLKFT